VVEEKNKQGLTGQTIEIEERKWKFEVFIFFFLASKQSTHFLM
jgi:hypothetical protein